MSLSIFIKSLSKEAVLLPLLRAHLKKEESLIAAKKLEEKTIVIEDAKLAIQAFTERMKEYNHRQKLDGDYFHPSQLGACLRQSFFDAMKAPLDRPKVKEDILRKALIFETGTYWHVLFQNLCARAKVLVSREVAIVDKANKVIGHADGIVKINGIKYLLEIKTINARGFDSLNGPKEGHRQQVHAYMHSLNLKWCVIVYIRKDTCETREYLIQYRPDYHRKNVRDRIDKFFASLRSLVPPPAEGKSPYKFPCSFCSFVEICYDKQATAKWLKLKKKEANEDKA